MKAFSAATTVKGIAKLLTLAALAVGATGALPSCTSQGTNETLGEERLAACNCPTDAGSCGSFTCIPLNSVCQFRVADGVRAGDRCMSAGAEDGTCMVVEEGRQGGFDYLRCCTGCVFGKTGQQQTCHPGTAVGYCGDRGLACDSCSDCESCSEGSCRPTSGNECGTCKVCDSGSCVNEEPGATCTGGHCALAATCCTSCIDENGACLSSTNEHCGTGGNACVDCGPCATCGNNGTCQPVSGGACNDGNPCTENEMCGNGQCTGTPIAVDDGNPCTVDACDAVNGVTHTNVTPGDACDDGSSCTTGETCDDHDNDPQTPFTCKADTQIDCTDGEACTTDSPDCNGGCLNAPVMDGTPCATGGRCIINKSCQNGVCAGEERNCNDDNPCTTDSCEESDGEDTDPVTGCTHVPKPTTTGCDDFNDCTEGDHCTSSGTCVGMPVPCTPLDECHGIGSCDPGTGACTDPRLQDGTACENTGVCADGVCEGGTPTGTGGSGGSGTGGSGTQGGEAGDDGTPGTGGGNEAGGAGEPAAGGGSGGSGTAGRGGSGTGASGGTSQGSLYVRDPGGCSCRVPGGTPRSQSYLPVLFASALALLRRRRRVVPS